MRQLINYHLIEIELSVSSLIVLVDSDIKHQIFNKEIDFQAFSTEHDSIEE